MFRRGRPGQRCFARLSLTRKPTSVPVSHSRLPAPPVALHQPQRAASKHAGRPASTARSSSFTAVHNSAGWCTAYLSGSGLGLAASEWGHLTQLRRKRLVSGVRSGWGGGGCVATETPHPLRQPDPRLGSLCRAAVRSPQWPNAASRERRGTSSEPNPNVRIKGAGGLPGITSGLL
jgi:hypothetical protein